MNRFTIKLFLLLLFFCPVYIFGQKSKSLKSKKEKIQQELKKADRLLKETKKNKQISLGELVIINKRIEDREALINTIRSQIRLLDQQIEEKHSIINAMEKDLKNLKAEYAKMIFQAYKNQTAYTKLLFIFSASDFNQAYKRLKYYQQYTAYRQNQAKIIEKTQKILNEKITELEVKKAEKEGLLTNENNERKTLSEEKQNQQKVLQILQTKEKKLKKQIEEKKKAAKQLQKAIEEAIRKEIEAQKKKGQYELTPEAIALMGEFEKNKGKLPWPVEKGLITGRFGKSKHPVLNMEINNNGIDISTDKTGNARAVYEGEVSKVILIPNAGKAVLVRHGEYLTVYFKLKEVFVNPGDKINTKDIIGSIITDEGTGKTELHFEVWKGKEILNPSQWLYKAY